MRRSFVVGGFVVGGFVVRGVVGWSFVVGGFFVWGFVVRGFVVGGVVGWSFVAGGFVLGGFVFGVDVCWGLLVGCLLWTVSCSPAPWPVRQAACRWQDRVRRPEGSPPSGR